MARVNRLAPQLYANTLSSDGRTACLTLTGFKLHANQNINSGEINLELQHHPSTHPCLYVSSRRHAGLRHYGLDCSTVP